MVKILQPVFSLIAKWIVTVAVSMGTGKGTTSPGPGSYQLDHGATFTITATPDAGSFFDHWNVDGVNVGSTNPLVLSE